MDCIFCKIVKGEIPCAKLYEDKNVLSFLDIGPINKGHALVIPKKHYVTIIDTPDDVLKDLVTATKKVTKAVKLATGVEGVNNLLNNGKASGQAVFHAHMHIIPRFEGDDFKFPWPAKKYGAGEMEEMRKNIVKLI
ncbi:MAG TPA: HIT family protein [Candidatus Nanoarchaeia archaeon]|nr:HIT family protein [Candidatus Nanoarchaeia archaeon]